MKNLIMLFVFVSSVVWSPSVFAKAKVVKRSPASVGQRYTGKSRAAVYRNAKVKKPNRTVASVKKAKAKKAAVKYKAHIKKNKHNH